jgi:ABC-type antimicrobial peptide transport system permease subunit
VQSPCPGLPHEIIGVVDDVRMWRPELPPDFQAYVSIIQRRAPASAIVVRTSDNDVAPAALSTAIQGLWPDAPVRVEIVDDTLHRLTAPQRTRAVLMFALALAGLALTLVALAGGLNEGVRSRRKELAVRIALGADSGRLVRAVVGEALVIVVAGIGLGLVAGVMAHRSIPEVFSGAAGADVRTVGVVALTFTLVALIASARAALLACRVDPARMLSAE